MLTYQNQRFSGYGDLKILIININQSLLIVCKNNSRLIKIP